jgi:hypothetical protein
MAGDDPTGPIGFLTRRLSLAFPPFENRRARAPIVRMPRVCNFVNAPARIRAAGFPNAKPQRQLRNPNILEICAPRATPEARIKWGVELISDSHEVGVGDGGVSRIRITWLTSA